MAEATESDLSAVADEATQSAAGTRKAALWIATALGGIPAIGILTALVRSPGESGFQPEYLWPGILLAAIGALVALLAFARVITPLGLEDSKLMGFDLTRVPGSPWNTFNDEFLSDIAKQRRAVALWNKQVDEAKEIANDAAKDATAAQKAAEDAKKEAAADPNNQTKQGDAAKAEARAAASKQDASECEENAQVLAETSVWADQLKAYERIRGDAYRLKAADEVKSRYSDALIATVFAVLAIALGIGLLALAPAPKAETSVSASPTLVDLNLNAKGRLALGCGDDFKDIQALRVGGTDEAPLLITFAYPECPSKYLIFDVDEVTSRGPFGSLDDPETPSPALSP
jgi:hypothetical protein